MTDDVACEFCGEEFREGNTDLPFHWYLEHLSELDDEQFRAASDEHNARLWESIHVNVPVTIPRDTWEDVVKADTDGADPADVSPADISNDTLIDLVEPEFDFRVAGREDPIRCAQWGAKRRSTRRAAS